MAEKKPEIFDRISKRYKKVAQSGRMGEKAKIAMKPINVSGQYEKKSEPTPPPTQTVERRITEPKYKTDYGSERKSLLDAIKKVPDAAPVAPSPDMKLRMQVGHKMDTLQERSNERALWAGATPLLMGFLTGNMGDAAEIAAKGLLQEDARRMKEEGDYMDRLSKIIASRKTASDRLYQVRDPKTGDLTYATAEEAHGALAPKRRRGLEEGVEKVRREGEVRSELSKKEYKELGKDIKMIKDPISGEEMAYSKSQRKIVDQPLTAPKEYPKGWTQTKEKLTQSTVKDFNSVSRKHDEALTSLKKARAALASGGKFQEKVGVMTLIKDIEQRISDYDRDFYIKELSWLRRFGDRIEKEFTGRLPEYVVREAAQSLDKALELTEGHIGAQASQRIRQLEAAGIDPKYARRRLGFKPSIKAKPMAPRKKSVKALKNTKSLKKFEKGLNNMSLEELDALEKQIRGGR